MYQQLLTGIFAAAGKTTAEEQEIYLESLKPKLEELWNAYQTQEVIVDYAHPDSQVCYLLRYLPVYSRLIREVLLEVRTKGSRTTNPISANTVTALFIGPGPGPEVVGLAGFLKEVLDTRKLIVHLYDRYNWSYARAIVREHVLPFQSTGNYEIFEHNADILDAAFSTRIAAELAQADVLIFQNCLNEVTHLNPETTKNNIIKLIEGLTPGKLTVLIDRDYFPAIKLLLQQIESKVAERELGEVILSASSGIPPFDGVNFSFDAMTPLLFSESKPGRLFDNKANGRKHSRYVPYIRTVIRRK